MNRFATLLPVAGLLAAAPINPPQNEVLDHAGFKAMVENLGYTTKEIGTDEAKKFEFTITKDGFNIPMAGEISPSKNYAWITVSFGVKEGESPKYREMLKANARVQPVFFYLTSKDYLMMGLAMDNRGINPTSLRRTIDKVSNDVVSTSDLWGSDD